MKRAALALLAFLGVACIAAAIAVPTLLVPRLKVVPLDLDITSVATSVPGDGDAGNRFPATILDRCSVTAKKAATLQAHLTQQRRSVIVDPSDAEQATLQSGQTLQIDRTRNAKGTERDVTMAPGDTKRTCDDGLLNATVDRVSVNRKSSAPNGNVSSLQTDPVPAGGTVEDASVKLEDRKGFQYKFGFDVKQTDYYYYDTTTRQDAIAKFVEEKTINGVKTYHFRAEVPERDLSDLPNPQGEATLGTILNMPASWWGIRGKGVKSKDLITMHRYGKAVRNVYVEPTTGTIIFGEEEQEQYFRSPDDSGDLPKAVSDYRLTAMQGTFAWNDATVAHQAERADKYLGQLRLGGVIVPIVLGVLGVLMLLGWALPVWLGRRGTGDAGPETPPTPDDGGNGAGGNGDGGNGDGGNGDGGNDGGGNDGGAVAPAEETTVFAPTAAAMPYDTPDDGRTTILPPLPDESSTQAIPTVDDAQPDPPTEAFGPQPLEPQPFEPSPYARPEQPVQSPADVTDTEAFRAPEAPADGFTPYTAEPTRPMPDVDKYQRDQ